MLWLPTFLLPGFFTFFLPANPPNPDPGWVYFSSVTQKLQFMCAQALKGGASPQCPLLRVLAQDGARFSYCDGCTSCTIPVADDKWQPQPGLQLGHIPMINLQGVERNALGAWPG